MILEAFGLFTLTAYWAVYLMLTVGCRRIEYLRDCPLPTPQARDSLPMISILIPARNEADTLQEALQTVQALQYPNLEILLIDDRSTDGTTALIQQLAEGDSRIQPIYIDSLPPGWLGKNHALYVGSAQAQGEYLLFTDADIHFSPSALEKAVRKLQDEHWSHLTVIPELIHPDWRLHPLTSAFFLFFTIKHRPWLATNPKSKVYMGVGAFNLIERTVYRQVGGHQRIALCPDDDMQLGRIVKHSGFSQGALWGTDEVRVAWYPTAQAFLAGLMKNTFALMNYRLGNVILAVIALQLVWVFPWLILAGLLVQMAWGEGVSQQCLLIYLLLIPSLYGILRTVSRPIKSHPLGFISFPVAAVLFAGVMLSSAYLALKHQGIYWRETFYPLSQLKASHEDEGQKES